MFGPRMHPGCFKSVLSLEDGAGAATVTAVPSKYSSPGICILAHSSHEITKDHHPVICRSALETAVEPQVIFTMQSLSPCIKTREKSQIAPTIEGSLCSPL